MVFNSQVAEAKNVDGILINGEYYIHSSIFYSFVIVFILSVILIYAGVKVKKADPRKKPKGIVFLSIMYVELLENYVKANMDEKKAAMAPYLGYLGLFILASNLSGLVGFTPPTSDFNVTFALALITIVLVQVYSLKENGVVGYFKGFFAPFKFMLPMNLLDLIATPFSMALRLFVNILVGGIILGLVYGATSYASVLIAPFLHGYFDIFAGSIQALVFVLLTSVFVNG